MLRRHGDRRDELQGIVDRNLGRLVQRVIIAALIDVVIADDIGDKNAVKNTPLERDPKLRPVFEILVLPRPIPWMRPQARRLMPDAVHVESIEADLPRHHRTPLVL
jgi:hypothetical protein